MKELKTRQLKKNQVGLSLVELLVAMAISLVVALAAATAYLGTRKTATQLEQISLINETGKLVLDMIGRELQMAGFYPAIYPNSTARSNFIGEFQNIKTGTAYNQGIFGCDGAKFLPTTASCPTTVAGAADSIVINYFSSPELKTSSNLTGRDCLRQNPSDSEGALKGDPANYGRYAADLPIIISNRFGINPNNYTAPNGSVVNTGSFACSGNGEGSPSLIYQPIFDGIEDMVIRYGVYANSTSLSPSRYHTATEVGSMPAVNNRNGWQRVTSVQVCILARTFGSSRSAAITQYENCRGETEDYLSSESNLLYKRFERVFAIRNNLTGTY